MFALEATGALHRAWAARARAALAGVVAVVRAVGDAGGANQLGTRRFKTDDRDCAALVWLAAPGRRSPGRADSASRRCWAAVSHRRQLILALKPLQPASARSTQCARARAVCSHRPRPRAGVGHADRPRGVGVRGGVRGPAAVHRSLQARAPGRMTDATAAFWVDALAGLPCAALGRRAARRAAGSRPRSL